MARTGDAPTPRPSKLFPAADASHAAWREKIAEYRTKKNVVALQALVEERPGRDASERARLLNEATAALASLGEPARLPFQDLLASPFRDVRLAAINAFVTAFPSERQAVLGQWLKDEDPVIRKKAEALVAALR